MSETPRASRPPLLEVWGLKRYFAARRGPFSREARQVKAVDGISFTLAPGETLGLVGESGCGKTTAGRSILGLLEPTEGTIIFEGRDVTAMRPRKLRSLRRRMQIIFQDPFSSLNPRWTVGAIVEEGLRIHRLGGAAARREKVRETLTRCGLDPAVAARYPHEFSGGERQRLGIARALVLEPKLIVCDEPVSALDVSIQSQIVNLLSDLKESLGIAYIFIAHDLSLVGYLSDRIAVMYLGKIVELAPAAELLANPLHPYTQALLEAVPRPDPRRRGPQAVLPGDVPSPLDPPPGCAFHPRCPLARAICRRVEAHEVAFGDHTVRCHAVPSFPPRLSA